MSAPGSAYACTLVVHNERCPVCLRTVSGRTTAVRLDRGLADNPARRLSFLLHQACASAESEEAGVSQLDALLARALRVNATRGELRLCDPGSELDVDEADELELVASCASSLAGVSS
ncbi:MAG: hypothetical protein ABI460_16570 [Caldimonas sp.]